MQAVAMQAAEEDIRVFIEEYFASWTDNDEQKILAYYSDDIALHVPTVGIPTLVDNDYGLPITFTNSHR